MNVLVKEAKNLTKKLINKKICSIVDIPEAQGVYLIYNKRNKIIYVGRSVNLFNRIKKNHLSGRLRLSAFLIQINRKYNIKEGEDIRNWVKKNCFFSCIEIKNSDLCNLVEALTIAFLRSNNCKLLNYFPR